VSDPYWKYDDIASAIHRKVAVAPVLYSIELDRIFSFPHVCPFFSIKSALSPEYSFIAPFPSLDANYIERRADPIVSGIQDIVLNSGSRGLFGI